MYKKSIAKGKFEVSIVSRDGCSWPFLDDLGVLEKNDPNLVEALKGMFARYSEQGKEGFSKKQLHESEPRKFIHQFRRGKIRAFLFFDDFGLVLLCGSSLKKSDKADPKQVKNALNMRTDYLAAKNNNKIIPCI